MRKWRAYILLASGRWFDMQLEGADMDAVSETVSEFVGKERNNGSRIITWFVELDR